jgi:hypothetical protein
VKILVFTEGTATMHLSQEKFFDVPSFIPTKGAVERLRSWQERGAEICYLTSRRRDQNWQAVEATLRRFHFPPGELYCREEGEEYVDVVRRVHPDVLVEDDCKSIGWQEVITPKLKPDWNIHSIVVPEFGGLAHLPVDPQRLRVP